MEKSEDWKIALSMMLMASGKKPKPPDTPVLGVADPRLLQELQDYVDSPEYNLLIRMEQEALRKRNTRREADEGGD